MPKPSNANSVKIHYIAKFKDGTVFDSSPKEKPFQFTIGDKNIIPELRKIVLCMEVGDTKTLKLSFARVFGKYDKRFVFPYPKDLLPNGFDVKKGQFIAYKSEDNEIKQVKVIEEDEINLYIDANHPWANKTLYYEIKLIEIE